MKHTDIIREALATALEICNSYSNNPSRDSHEVDHALCVEVPSKIEDALAALKAMEEQEPVAWMVETTNTRNGEVYHTFGMFKDSASYFANERFRLKPNWKHGDPIPIYTHPAPSAAVELSEQDIERMVTETVPGFAIGFAKEMVSHITKHYALTPKP